MSAPQPALADAMQVALAALFDGASSLTRLELLPGGASKESWAADLPTPRGTMALLVRRAGGGTIDSQTLTLEQEYRVVEAAYAEGVRVPRPYAYLPDVAGRPAFVTERVPGETIGRRIILRPELAAARAALPSQMADELAKIHAIAAPHLPFLPEASPRAGVARLERELDALDEPHPAIELGLAWLRAHAPTATTVVVSHGDFRVGNLVVGPSGLTHVLDWEFAHRSDPAEDLAWPCVRAWRFGADRLRLGGVGDVEPYLERYRTATDIAISLEAMRFWELFGNARWAIGALTQARRHLRGEERSVELAVLGRIAAETELELLELVDEAG